MQEKFEFANLDSQVAHSILLLQTHQPKDKAYYGCFSGGKDSCVIKELARMAGVNVEWHYNVTTIDPPELVHFIRREHPDVIFEHPKHGNFFRRMVKKGFPLRTVRWCCEEYKEQRSPVGAALILGVRSAESAARAKAWKELSFHRRTKTWALNPILSWSDDEVWEFIRRAGLSYCRLYDEGFTRLGCIGCPMSRAAGRAMEFKRWPKYEDKWKAAFRAIWEERTRDRHVAKDGREWFGSARFNDWHEMWLWWLSNDPLPPGAEDECQLMLDMWRELTMLTQAELRTLQAWAVDVYVFDSAGQRQAAKRVLEVLKAVKELSWALLHASDTETEEDSLRLARALQQGRAVLRATNERATNETS